MSQASSIPPAPAPVAPPPAKSGPGFMPLVLGGIVAGLIGYVLAYATEFRLMPNLFGRADPAAEVAAVRDDLSAQAERLAAVEGSASAAGEAASAAAEQANAADQAAAAAATAAADAADAAAAAASQASTVGDGLAALEAQVSELTPVEGDLPPAVVDALRSAALDQVEALGERVGAVEGTVGTVEESVGALTEQIEALGGIQAGATSEQMSAYEEQLAVLQAELDAQRESIAAAQAEAEAMTAAAAVQQKAVLAEAALSRVKAAVDGGGAFDGPLSELSASTEVAIPEILMGIAGTGIRSLPHLQDSFPVAARAGLDAAVAELAGTGTAMDRVGNFLRNQTGARSLSEREGDDPDAILSRAQARLSEGDVAAALAEIATLNEAGQAAMADWVSEASARVAAQSAVDDLSTALAAE